MHLGWEQGTARVSLKEDVWENTEMPGERKGYHGKIKGFAAAGYEV